MPIKNQTRALIKLGSPFFDPVQHTVLVMYPGQHAPRGRKTGERLGFRAREQPRFFDDHVQSGGDSRLGHHGNVRAGRSAEPGNLRCAFGDARGEARFEIRFALTGVGNLVPSTKTLRRPSPARIA